MSKMLFVSSTFYLHLVMPSVRSRQLYVGILRRKFEICSKFYIHGPFVDTPKEKNINLS
jgi:hypothetical protein